MLRCVKLQQWMTACYAVVCYESVWGVSAVCHHQRGAAVAGPAAVVADDKYLPGGGRGGGVKLAHFLIG
jgi:hypothetical protein